MRTECVCVYTLDSVLLLWLGLAGIKPTLPLPAPSLVPHDREACRGPLQRWHVRQRVRLPVMFLVIHGRENIIALRFSAHKSRLSGFFVQPPG